MHGLCEDGICKCFPGYYGDGCLSKANGCPDDFCENGGTCEDTEGDYKCACPQGTTGGFDNFIYIFDIKQVQNNF